MLYYMYTDKSVMILSVSNNSFLFEIEFIHSPKLFTIVLTDNRQYVQYYCVNFCLYLMHTNIYTKGLLKEKYFVNVIFIMEFWTEIRVFAPKYQLRLFYFIFPVLCPWPYSNSQI